MDYRKVHAVNMSNLRRRPDAPSDTGARFCLGRLGAAAFVLLANATVAVAQSTNTPAGGDPLEETWRYLMDLFRMIIGL